MDPILIVIVAVDIVFVVLAALLWNTFSNLVEEIKKITDAIKGIGYDINEINHHLFAIYTKLVEMNEKAKKSKDGE
jgi:uncharacterized protein YoxC